jgi:hypothetical protein
LLASRLANYVPPQEVSDRLRNDGLKVSNRCILFIQPL